MAQWLRCCATVGLRWHSGYGAVLQWDRGSTVVKVLCYSGTAAAQWSRCCATNRKVAGSICSIVSKHGMDQGLSCRHLGPYDAKNHKQPATVNYAGGPGRKRRSTGGWSK